MVFFTFLLGVALCTAVGYFLVRLNWVKQFQTVVLMRSPAVYMHLPNLKTMMWKQFWVWDDSVFLPDPDMLRRE